MKTFVISIVIMAVIITAAILNACATKSATDELLGSLAEVAQTNTPETFDKFCSLWKKYEFYFDITVSKQKLEHVLQGMAMIQSAMIASDDVCFGHGVIIAENAIKEIAELSCFSMKNIL